MHRHSTHTHDCYPFLNHARSSALHTALQHYARAQGVLLHQEFGVPFVLYEAASGHWLATSANDPFETPLPQLPPETVRALAHDGPAAVRTVAPGDYQLSLVLYEANKPRVLAAARFVGLAATGAQAEGESRWLRQWLDAVGQRMRLTDQLTQRVAVEDPHSQTTSAWGGLVALDQVMRRLRMHKEPVKNFKRIVETAFELVPVQSLICLAPAPTAEPVVQGEQLLSAEECRAVADALATCADFKESEPFFYSRSKNPPWGNRFPAIETLLALPLLEAAPHGWLIAVNKGKARHSVPGSAGAAPAFRSSDAALLLPFVALLRLQCVAGGRYQELKELVVGLARSLTAAIDAKGTYTYGHSERVARIALELGHALQLGADELSDLYLAGLLHDVGKIGVPDDILRKKEPLSLDEFEAIKQHVTIGYAILADLRPIRHLLPGVLHHHEHWDGKGYPEGLEGAKIPFLARILAVADAYDAMSTDRPYRTAMPFAKVEERLRAGAGVQWDPSVIEALLKCRHKIHAIRQRGVGESLRQALDGVLRSKGSTNVL